MICRACLRRASTLPWQSTHSPIIRPFSTSLRLPNAAVAATPPSKPTPADAVPADLKPLVDGTAAETEEKKALSSCPAGTTLQGLNYFKAKTDPVALSDEEYPEWLWTCLDVQKKATAEDDTDIGDEFSKSKKQRKLALKRQRQLEAKILKSGDLSALAPKIPLQKQSINLPGKEDGSVVDNLVAAEKREELRKAMRKERKAKIKESNFLQSM